MRLRSKIIAIALSLTLIVTLLPCAAFAAGENQNGAGAENPSTEPKTASEAVTGETETEPEETTEPTGSAADQMEEPATEPTEATQTTTSATTTKASAQPTDEGTAVSRWKAPRGKKTAKLTLRLYKGGPMFNLTERAGQKLYQYDTLQGACANRGYGYFILYNRKVTRCKIVKVRLKDMEVIKVSGVLDVCHGNDMTYNTRKNYIVVANSDPKAKRLSVVDPNTLKIKFHKTISMKKSVSGMSKKQRKKFKGVGAIAYNEKHNCYVCRTRKDNCILLLDANFKPYKRIKQKSRLNLLYQGMDSYQDCIMIGQSFKGKKKYNAITVYNMKGKYLARYTIPKGAGLELETVFHDGTRFYTCFYRCYGAKTDSQKLKVHRLNYIYRINNL